MFLLAAQLGSMASVVISDFRLLLVLQGTGYVYLCLPWIKKFQWHAFSLVMHPTVPAYSAH